MSFSISVLVDGARSAEPPTSHGSRGAIAKRYPYNYQQSFGKVTADGPVPGNVSLQVSEENPRQFYRRWRDYMNDADWDTLLGRHDAGPASVAG